MKNFKKFKGFLIKRKNLKVDRRKVVAKLLGVDKKVLKTKLTLENKLADIIEKKNRYKNYAEQLAKTMKKSSLAPNNEKFLKKVDKAIKKYQETIKKTAGIRT